MLLFFKAIYRGPILRDEKTDTIRLPKRLPRVGSTVQACVGPSRIFARLLITAAEPIASLSPERRRQVEECYGALDPAMVRLSFVRLPQSSDSD
jgi:hypothetical protein